MSIYREHIKPIETQDDFIARIYRKAEKQIEQSILGNMVTTESKSGYANGDIHRALAMAPMEVPFA